MLSLNDNGAEAEYSAVELVAMILSSAQVSSWANVVQSVSDNIVPKKVWNGNPISRGGARAPCGRRTFVQSLCLQMCKLVS